MKHFVHKFDEGWKSDRHVFGLVFRRFAIGIAWITRWSERPKIIKVPEPRHCRRLCVFFYRFGIAYRIGRVPKV